MAGASRLNRNWYIVWFSSTNTIYLRRSKILTHSSKEKNDDDDDSNNLPLNEPYELCIQPANCSNWLMFKNRPMKKIKGKKKIQAKSNGTGPQMCCIVLIDLNSFMMIFIRTLLLYVFIRLTSAVFHRFWCLILLKIFWWRTYMMNG